MSEQKLQITEMEKKSDRIGEVIPTPKTGKNIATLQFKYKKYQTIIDVLKDNKKILVVHKARNWRSVFDLSDQEQKAVYDGLMSSDRLGEDYKVINDVDKNSKATEKADTLRILLDKSVPELRGMISGDELDKLGLSRNCSDRIQLISAISNKSVLK